MNSWAEAMVSSGASAMVHRITENEQEITRATRIIRVRFRLDESARTLRHLLPPRS
jgi:hypothetical protein